MVADWFSRDARGCGLFPDDPFCTPVGQEKI